MITFSANVLAMLSNPTLITINLVRVAGYRLTDHHSDVTLSDNTEYEASGTLASVQAPQLSSVVDSASYTVVFADPDLAYGAVAETLIGKPFEVRLGFVNPTNGLVYTNIGDTVVAYAGTVASALYSKNTTQMGEILLEVTGGSPMSNFEMIKTFHTTRDYLAQLSPTDTAFEQVYENSGPVRMRWGKK